MAVPNTNQQPVQRTQEQKRAGDAWNCVASVINWGNNDKKSDFRSLASGAPTDIQVNGLGQTLAFWRAKGKVDEHTHQRVVEDEENHLFSRLSSWIQSQFQFTQADVLVWIRDAGTSTDQYRRATAEAIAYLIWIKRFAEAELPKR